MSVLDNQLVLSNNQNIGVPSGTGGATFLAEKYLDMGDPGTDTWGTNTTIYPGWWRPNAMVLNVKTGAVSGTAMATTTLTLALYGTDLLASVTSSIVTQMLYYRKTELSQDWWKGKAYKNLWTIGLTKTNHRYLFLLYTLYSIPDTAKYANLNAHINFDEEALSVGPYPKDE